MRFSEPNSIAPRRNNHRVPALAVFASSKIAMATFFFLLAGLVRVYFIGANPDFDNIFSVRGVPYSDGYVWVSPAIALTEGHGLGGVFRPGLSVVLALYYVWFGISFSFISWLHVLIGAVTAAFIYLVGERVFARTIGAVAALFFVFDPSQLTQTPQPTTEPLGLMFFVISVYCLLVRERAGEWKFSLLAGVFLALSNLTRPLTLVCAGFYVVYLALADWLRTKKAKKALLPACAFCLGLVVTLSPWLIRQRSVHGVWSISTNLGEALYGATSPKYKTWKYTVRADADRAGIEPTMGARYRFFIAESLKNIQRNPTFYAHQVSRSYWNLLNSFSLAARSDQETFDYGLWTGLREAQILFWLCLVALLAVAVLQMWTSAGALGGGLVAFFSLILLLCWHFAPLQSGVFILIIGAVTGLLRRPWRGITVVGGSLAVTALGSAIFNNAILYRAVLMTDWIFSLFYFAAFYFTATLLAQAALRRSRAAPIPADPAGVSEALETGQTVAQFERGVLFIWKSAAVLLAAFIFAGTIRLLVLNFGGTERTEPPRLRLTDNQKEEIISQLRERFPVMRESLADPRAAEVELSGTPVTPSPVVPFDRGTQMLVWSEPLSPFLYYFPARTEFELRDRLFRRREYDCSIFRTSRGMAIYPEKIPQSFRDHPVVFVGWIAGPHPNGTRFGQVIQCVAVIPVLAKNGGLDYKHAEIAKPQPGIL